MFALKEIAVVKVGISIDPLTRICNLPQFHLQVEDVFDLGRSVAIHALHRKDARELERAVLQHLADWRVAAPCSDIVYVDGKPSCTGPIRFFSGGRTEWLNASAYDSAIEFLLFANRSSARSSISMETWMRELKKGSLQ